MKNIYVIVNELDSKPIIVATSIEKAEELLHQYINYGKDPNIKYFGFMEYNTEYSTPCDGIYTYYIEDKNKEYEIVFILYCMKINEIY